MNVKVEIKEKETNNEYNKTPTRLKVDSSEFDLYRESLMARKKKILEKMKKRRKLL